METLSWCLLCFPHLAKRALAEDFEQFKLRRIRFLTALFHMVGDRNLLICPIILHKRYQYETATQHSRCAIRNAHEHTRRALEPIIILTQCEKDSPSSMGSSMIWCPLTCSQNHEFHQRSQQQLRLSQSLLILVFSWAGPWLQLLHAHMYDGRFNRWNWWVTCNNSAFSLLQLKLCLLSNSMESILQTRPAVELSSCPYKAPHY